MQLTQDEVDSIDWAVVGLSGVLFAVSTGGAIYTVLYSGSRKSPVTKQFNYLWRARFFSQVLAALYAAAQILRLQVLWGPESPVISGGYYPTIFCRAYTALAYGLFEPSFLLLALFACIYSLQGKASSVHPNFNIVFFSLGFSLPTCAAQLVCALFTRIFDLDYSTWLFHTFFSTYDMSQTQYCPQLQVSASGGVKEAGTASDTGCGTVLKLRVLCLPTPQQLDLSRLHRVLPAGHVGSHAAHCGCSHQQDSDPESTSTAAPLNAPTGHQRGMPGSDGAVQAFDLGFEVLRLVQVFCVVSMVLVISYVLVLKPVYDAHVADQQLKQFEMSGGGSWPATGPAAYQPPVLQESHAATQAAVHSPVARQGSSAPHPPASPAAHELSDGSEQQAPEHLPLVNKV
eukprot:CAMPEP_0202908950 /NCGR_PEP_ID=MMETSP1392-20130828/47715_1 /ASSEMBLY_ACC=CAM_ASM_000868 /TAXON_ID=225041 /ORGANISM="Chlamydomonas chlamydogama, Strain SAG 11-48b" /LENGTH=399 /DNA_ID=CAMNT_0049598505 /DNA_START=604 /DNA_END=1803 /DNA_ORIENTATION=-